MIQRALHAFLVLFLSTCGGPSPRPSEKYGFAKNRPRFCMDVQYSARKTQLPARICFTNPKDCEFVRKKALQHGAMAKITDVSQCWYDVE